MNTTSRALTAYTDFARASLELVTDLEVHAAVTAALEVADTTAGLHGPAADLLACFYCGIPGETDWAADRFLTALGA